MQSQRWFAPLTVIIPAGNCIAASRFICTRSHAFRDILLNECAYMAVDRVV